MKQLTLTYSNWLIWRRGNGWIAQKTKSPRFLFHTAASLSELTGLIDTYHLL